ncbi:MAG TPA: hypothetical protein VHE35_28975 [Kofleriaceae bacterium]|nr:hypothetical protein [Kofleriaceae bacterium]
MRGFAVLLLLAAAGAGCGDNLEAAEDAGVDATPPFSTAEFGAAMPQVAGANRGTLATPKVVPITYDGDPLRADVEAFFPDLAASTAWAAQTAEYGVGPLTVGTARHLAGPAPAHITDSQIVGILRANLTGANPAWGAPDPNTVYDFVFPAGTIVDDGDGYLCCEDYDGYHWDDQVGGVDVAYALQCECHGFDGPDIDDLQQLTVVASHEIVEAVTDPRGAGFAQVDPAHSIWDFVYGGETADMCVGADTTYWVDPADMHYAIQRTWSNAIARAGHDPCVGEAQATYYQTIPDQPDQVTLDDGAGDRESTHGVKLAMGASGTLTLHVYADQPDAGPFNVAVDDLNHWFTGGRSYLTITSPTGEFHVGDLITVPVTVTGRDPAVGAEGFVVTTTPPTGPSTYYYGVVGQ